MKNLPKYNPEKCVHCGQTTTYALAIDRGTVDILKAISVAIRNKGKNVIHPRKEMEVAGLDIDYKEMVLHGYLTSNQVGNLSRPRRHGLIAAVKGYPGNYALTPKGAAFLRGESIPRVAIVSKSLGHNIGYVDEDVDRCTIYDFKPDGSEYWEGMNYSIINGQVITKLPVPAVTKKETTASLFSFS